MWDMFQGYGPPLQKQILMRMMWGTIFKVRSVPRMALCLQSFLFSPKFVFGFQYNPICRDFRSESRYWNKHNTSLHLWPPSSSSSLWMRGNNGGEGGRLRHYSGVCWKYTSSRIAHSIQATKVWENLLARCFTRGCCRWKLFCLLHWGKKNHN